MENNNGPIHIASDSTEPFLLKKNERAICGKEGTATTYQGHATCSVCQSAVEISIRPIKEEPPRKPIWDGLRIFCVTIYILLFLVMAISYLNGNGTAAQILGIVAVIFTILLRIDITTNTPAGE